MTPDVKKVYNNRLSSKLYGLLCEREKGRDVSMRDLQEAEERKAQKEQLNHLRI